MVVAAVMSRIVVQNCRPELSSLMRAGRKVDDLHKAILKG